MFIENGHVFSMPENDKRDFPIGAADAAFDVDGYHWKDGYPEKSGYYMVALHHDYSYCPTCSMRLIVEKAYYSKNKKEWSRKKCPKTSCLREQFYLDEGDGGFWDYIYYVEYWCEIPESGELLPCILNF